MSNYTVKSGDNLWNIVKRELKVSSNAEIAKKVSEIAKNNGISNPSLIYAGNKIEIGDATDKLEKTQNTETSAGNSEPTEEKIDTAEAERYFNWATNPENAEKTKQYIPNDAKGEAPVEQFDFLHTDMTKVAPENKAKTYIDGVLNFAKSIIARGSTDEDTTTLSFEEYKAEMSKGIKNSGPGTLDEVKAKNMFEALDINDDGKLDEKEEAASIAYLDKSRSDDPDEKGKMDGKIDHKTETLVTFTKDDTPVQLKETYNFLFGN